MKKKIILISCIMAMSLTMVACSNANNEPQNSPGVEDTAQPGDQTGQDQTGQDQTGQDQTTDQGATGEEQNAALEGDLGKAYQAVVGAYENYAPSMQLSPTEIEDQFGVKPEWCVQEFAELPMISMHVDKFVAIEANKDNVDEVKTALEAYRDKIAADQMQYPMNLGKVQATKVYTNGNYVFLISLGELNDELEGDAAVTYYEDQNKIAIDAIEGVLGK